MNQLSSRAQQQQSQVQCLSQPHQINVNIVVKLQQSNMNMQVQIDPEIPFCWFVNGIKEQIFAQRTQIYYQDTIEYQLGSVGQINSSETRSLHQLGFKANCTLYVRLELKTGD